jgi:hypothetical protein
MSVDDGEKAFPVLACRERCYDESSQLGRCQQKPKEQQTRSASTSALECECAEVLVEREQDSLLEPCSLEDSFVWSCGRIGTDPRDVMTSGASRLDDRSREVLVGEQAHATLLSVWWQKYALFLENPLCISEAGPDIFRRYAGIVFDDLVWRPPVRE